MLARSSGRFPPDTGTSVDVAARKSTETQSDRKNTAAVIKRREAARIMPTMKQQVAPNVRLRKVKRC